jgi:hypothetical protein
MMPHGTTFIKHAKGFADDEGSESDVGGTGAGAGVSVVADEDEDEDRMCLLYAK